jgi:hypothetical protein
VGREPVGTLGSAAPASDVISALLSATEHFLRRGYFVTQDLAKDLASLGIDGVGPIIEALLSLFRCDIINVDAIRHAGDLAMLRIVFRRDKKVRTLYYLSCDLRDDARAQRLLLATSLGEHKSFASLIKCGSYLLHEPEFAWLRSLIVGKSTTIVQDPSGIPFRVMLEAGYSVRLFGDYRTPPDVFRKYPQSDLAAAYRHGDIAPLRFPFGYRKDGVNGSLMLARC